MTDTVERPLESLAKALVDAVQRDDTGAMVGGEWRGGNGGLLSRDTLKAADGVRKELARLKAERLDLAAYDPVVRK